LVFLEGRLNYQTWEADGGQKRSKLEVVANNVQFLTRQGEKVSMDPDNTTSAPAADDIPF
jgi:single-strand DNA-binding protein